MTVTFTLCCNTLEHTHTHTWTHAHTQHMHTCTHTYTHTHTHTHNTHTHTHTHTHTQHTHTHTHTHTHVPLGQEAWPVQHLPGAVVQRGHGAVPQDKLGPPPAMERTQLLDALLWWLWWCCLELTWAHTQTNKQTNTVRKSRYTTQLLFAGCIWLEGVKGEWAMEKSLVGKLAEIYFCTPIRLSCTLSSQ